MMTISSLTFSYHAQVERADRIAIIDNHIGWGQIVKEVYFNGCYHCVTDTGLVLVVDDTAALSSPCILWTEESCIKCTIIGRRST